MKSAIEKEGKEKEELIFRILKEHPEGLSTEDLSRLTGLSRLTVAKYLHGLIIADQVKQRNVGPAKLSYLNKYFRGLKLSIILLLSGFFVFNLFTTDGIALFNFSSILQEIFLQALQSVLSVAIFIFAGIFTIYKIVTATNCTIRDKYLYLGIKS